MPLDTTFLYDKADANKYAISHIINISTFSELSKSENSKFTYGDIKTVIANNPIINGIIAHIPTQIQNFLSVSIISYTLSSKGKRTSI